MISCLIVGAGVGGGSEGGNVIPNHPYVRYSLLTY